MTTPRERIVRPSSLTTYLDCPRRWAARHLTDEVTAAGYDLARAQPSSAGALVGSGVHAGNAYTLEQKRACIDSAANDAVQAGIEGLRQRIQTEGAAWDETTPSLNTAEQQVARMIKTYLIHVAPQIRPLEVEERLEAIMSPTWILSGQVDALALAATNTNSQVLRDTKTGTQRRANAVQYGAYALILEAHGFNPARLIEDFIQRVPLKKEQPAPASLHFDPAEAKRDAFEAIRALMRDTEDFRARQADPNGEPPHHAFRANPASSLCSARWCPAWGSRWCKSHRPVST
jgi:hypothetical protein